MFGLAYVILPVSAVPPAEAIAESLARFKNGGRDDVPADWLTWHDRTAEVLRLHQTPFVFHYDTGLRIEGAESWLLDIGAIIERMKERSLNCWRVRFADLEPSLDKFARSYVRPLERHPVTGGFGRWLNPLGHWDWWDMGGRFDGIITGQRKHGRRPAATLSSGPSKGRAVLDKLATALGADGEWSSVDLDITADDNVEFISLLIDELAANRQLRLPTDIVLPADGVADEQRWLTTWPKVGPPAALDHLGLHKDVPWRQIVEAAYLAFPDHWAAGVAFHF